MRQNKNRWSLPRQILLTPLVLLLCCTASSAEIVINEVMFHPFEAWPSTQPFKTTNRTEFVEIHNAGTATASLIDYRFDTGITFDFLPGAMLAPGAYLVICENLETFTNAYPLVSNVVGDFGGALNNAGERITLSRFDGTNWVTEDTFEYIDDEIVDGTGRTLELVYPGFARLRDQFYGDWYSSITVSGTPGVVNSVFDPTPLPVLGDVNHDPPLPPAASIVTITARITGRDGDDVDTANLMYRRDADPPLPWKNESMVDDGDRGDVISNDGIYTVVVPTIHDPPFAAGDVMEFRIDIGDTHGSRTYPATNRAGVFPGPWSYFCKFGEDTESDVAFPGEYRTLHLLMTEIDRLAFKTNLYSLSLIGGLGECTLLFDTTLVTSDGEIFYNSSLRCRGGSSKHVNYGGYRVEVPEGMNLDGKSRFNLNYVTGLDQFIGMTIFECTTPGVSLDVDLARLWINQHYKNPPSSVSGQGIYVLLEPFNDAAIRARYPPGQIGNRYSADGDHRTGYLQYIGDNPASYFNLYFINENNPYTAFSEIVDFSRILDQDATNYPTTLTNRMNIRQWARHMATQVCIDNGEAGFATPGSGGGDELRFYVDETDGQFDIFPWDLDSIIGSGAKIWDYGTSGSPGGNIIAKFLYNDPLYPYYVGDVYDIITTIMSQENMTELFDSMGSKMNSYKTSYLDTFNIQRINLLNEFNSTNLAINGHTPGAPFVILEPDVTEFPVTVNISQVVTPPQWVFLATNTFRGQGEDFVRLTTLKSGRSGTVADAMLFSNAVAGATIVDNDDAGFSVSTNLSWEGFFATGGYTNGSYLRTQLEDRTAVWNPSLPTNGLYDVYAWLNPGTGQTTNAIYDITAVHIDFGLPSNGVAPQNYTARVTRDGTNAVWNQRNGKWATPGSIRMNRGVRQTTLQAIDSEGAILESLDVLAIANLYPQSIEDQITSDTTWNAVDRIFSITTDVTVSAGARLSVESGTVVLLEPGSTLTVNGRLEIGGEPSQPAYFLPRSAGSDWHVQILNASGSMTVSNAHFIGGHISVSGGSTLHLENSTIEHSQHANGIISSSGGSHVHLRRSIVRDFAKTRFDSSPTLVEECLFENMSNTGIEFVGSAPTSTVRRTTFRVSEGTGADAVLFDSTSAGLVDNCLFESIPGNGVEIDNATASIMYSVLEGCGTGIETTGSSAVGNVNNTITKGPVGINGNQSITNAIIWSVGASAVGGPATVTYSDIELPGTNIYAGTANINRNPWFRNEVGSDYRLLSISPARGGGLGSENMGASFPVGANPATPTSLTLDADTNAIHLAWQDNSADEESAFEIERSLDGTNWLCIATVGADVTNYWDVGLAQNTEFHYRVRAAHIRGLSFYSDPASRITGIEDDTQLLIDNLRITEFMYNPLDANDGDEFIEIKNISQTEILDLSGLFLDNGRYTFPPGASLAPTNFFVLVRDPVAFGIVHPGVAIGGVYAIDDALSNAGETLWIQDAGSNDLVRFRYEGGNNDPNWYPTTDGDGHSMVSDDPNPATGDPNSPFFWRASANVGGSAGADDPNPGIGTVVINELLAHQDLPSGDVVELYNAGSSAVDIGGWFLSDDENSLRKYSFSPGTIIGASNYLLRTETSHFGPVPTGTNGFAFSELGDEIILSSGSGGSLTSYRTMESFGATANNVSLGRHTRSDSEVDFVAMSGQTPLAANSLPRVGPVVINEIMYNPAAGGKEYIELLNTSPFPVPLYDIVHPTNTWQFDGAMEYTFPTGVTMVAGEHLLVVSVRPDEFRQLFGLSNSPVRVFGPFSGNLNNAGESVKFYYPGQPEPGGFVPRIRTDRVRYDDDPPWPTSADNGGPSLERKVALDYGNDPANWVAASIGGTPGIANNTIGLPSVGFPDISSAVIESNDTIVISMSLLPQVTSTVTVQYAVSGGTATRDSDYTFEDETLIFWPYDTSHTIPLTILDDATPSGESDETVEISITSVSSEAVIGGNAVYTHTIIDNDATSLAAPTITPSVDMTFTNAIIVSMAPGVANSDIYYTIDGSRPSRDDILYQNPFILATSARVTARTFLGSANDGGSTSSTSVLLTEQPVDFGDGGPPGQPTLFVTVDATQANEVVIMWTGDPADTFTIYRSTNLLTEIPGEVILNAIPGHPSGTNAYTDNDGISPAAYYTIGTDAP